MRPRGGCTRLGKEPNHGSTGLSPRIAEEAETYKPASGLHRERRKSVLTLVLDLGRRHAKRVHVFTHTTVHDTRDQTRINCLYG